MNPTVSFALALLATGCWKLDDPGVGYDTIPLENQHVTNPDLVVQTFEPTPPLECPDGSPATFYAVYDTKLTGAVPLAVVFHSGAFDYVKNPSQDNPLEGTHFASEDRLNLEWAQLRVFSTLGMWEEEVDPNETHTGALVTALAQQLAALQKTDPDAAWVEQPAEAAHVFTNKNVPLAFEVVRFLFP